ncbi:MAG TPA: pitrilysin family protein [Pyrinomonadaceae bacterium]
MMTLRKLSRHAALALLLFSLSAPFAPARSQAARKLNGSVQTIELPRGVQRVASVEGITEYSFPNGLRVLLFPEGTKQTITVNVTYLVGSSRENYGETGMAHLLEHLLFKGTPKHPNILQELVAHGTTHQGTTEMDRTNYFETFAATAENLKWALEMEADRMINSFIAKKDLESEMTVVRNEFERNENNPISIMFQRGLQTAYIWHNYGKIPIGARSDIENVPIERLQAFYKLYYQPDNAVLVISGKIDEAQTLALIDTTFGAIPRPARKLQKIYTTEPVQDGERVVVIRRPGGLQVAGLGYHLPAGAHPDFAPLRLLMGIMADTPAGRLYQSVVQTRKATGIIADVLQARDPGFLFFGAEVRQGDSVEEARRGMMQTIAEISSRPITREELERERTLELKDIEQALNSVETFGTELSQWIAMGDWRLFFLFRDRLRKVTPEDVQRVALKYLKPSNTTSAIFIPTDKPDYTEVPTVTDEELAAMLKDYKGEGGVTAGEAFDPSPANIEARTLRRELPVGMKLALLPKRTRGATVVATLTLYYGDEKSLLNRSASARLLGGILISGTLKRSGQEIQNELDRLKAHLNISSGPTKTTLTLDTVRENLPAVLKLVAEILREPQFHPSVFEQIKLQTLAEIEQRRTDPETLAQKELARHLNPYPKGDVRYQPTIEESLADTKAVTLADARKFYADFYGASNARLAVVGDFDEKEITKLVEDLFGKWRSPHPFAPVEFVYRDVPPINRTIVTPDKANAVYRAAINLNLRETDQDFPALLVGNYMLGGTLDSRLNKRIRGKEGISYGLGSNINAGAIVNGGSFVFHAIYAPQNLQRLEAAFREEIELALKDGFTTEEVEAAKTGLLQLRQLQRGDDPRLANTLASYLLLRRTFNWDAELERRIRALTPQEIQAALRRHIIPSKFTVIKAGDFRK